MSFDPVWWALAKKKGGGFGGGDTPSGGDNFPIGDGNTHIWISLAEGRTSPMLGVVVDGTVTVDWGDGSETETLTGDAMSIVYTQKHEYNKAGNYVITLTASEGSRLKFYGSSSGSYLLTHNGAYGGANSAYRAAVRKIELGKAALEYSDSGWCLLSALSDFVFSANFEGDDVTGFKECKALQAITLPNTTSSISADAFSGCTGLTKMIFPVNVSEVSFRAFQNCSGVSVFDFSQNTSVPALSATNAFTGIAADCQIRVPAALVDEWKAATNWSTYADYIVGV